ncbi:MAG: outer membrane lipoprotein-sorting protein [Bdellovibrionales bacterium]|nr:outer membrane lipoprotein-sorting protein [Bdellovibrionales bacterium]
MNRSLLTCIFLLLLSTSAFAETTPYERIQAAIHYWREDSSRSDATMIIHRPDWERTMRMHTWTKGLDHSLIRFVAPKKDSGTASLKIKQDMWSFTPKINRIIKIPGSMMHQSWMGSDFSYNDLARDDDLIEQYQHTYLPTETSQENGTLYVIQSIPHDDAPVVWGKEVIKVREDNIIVEHTFFDQEMIPVKQLQTLKIAPLGGKLFPVELMMKNLETPDEWTTIIHHSVQFDLNLSSNLFTLSNLRNPRQEQ